MNYTDIQTVKQTIFLRPDDANKGTMGSLLSICGSYGMAGAAMMAGEAALRCGLGLLKSALPKSIYPIVAPSFPESVYFPIDETKGKISFSNLDFLLEQADKSKAVLVGCGLGVCDDTIKLVNSLIQNCSVPMVIDADALNCVALNPDVLKSAKAPIIITPHPAEMGRLLSGVSAKTINTNRAKTAVDFSKKYNVVTVLKGSGTVIASPDGRVNINPTGNSGMATGGSGDVLAGMTSALLAQGSKPFESAVAAVYLHGLAGDIAAKKLGKISMLPTDIIDCISKAFLELGF